MDMTSERREALKTVLDAFERALGAYQAQRKPIDEAIAALEEIVNGHLQLHGIDSAEMVMRCEGDHLILPGDKYHSCSDGPVLCEACAPTYGDVLDQLREPGQADPDRGEDELAELKVHIDTLELMTPEQLAMKAVTVYQF